MASGEHDAFEGSSELQFYNNLYTLFQSVRISGLLLHALVQSVSQHSSVAIPNKISKFLDFLFGRYLTRKGCQSFIF